MKRLLLFIATEKGYTALRRMADNCLIEHIGAVVTFKEVNVEETWGTDICNICLKCGIPFFWWSEVKNSLPELIQKNAVTGAVTISWRYLLPLSINEYLEDDLIVFHDSLLPRYRGFAPTPTAIICGEKTVGVTAIYATDQTDQGNIVLQKSVDIPSQMYIKEIIQKQAELCADLLEEILAKMESGSLIGYPQDESFATYSVWRNPEDCRIDWEWHATKVYNFIRALGYPYPGAYSYLGDEKIKILKAELVPYDLNFALRDCGKIWRIVNGEPEIICGEGLIRIQYAEDEGKNPVQFTKVRCRLK